MNYKALKAEILKPAYNGMSDTEIIAALNTKDQTRNKTSLSGSQILEAIDTTALMALTGDKATRVWGILGMVSVDPFGNAAQVLINAFGAGSATITALAALRTESVSRAEIIGINPDDLSVQVINNARIM